MIQEAPALGNSDSFITTDNMPDRASRLVQRSFGKISNRVGDSAPIQSDLVLFPKPKSPLKGERFQIIDEIQENTRGQLMASGRTVWGPKVPTLKGTEASLSHVQCFSYLVSSSINVSIFILHGWIPSGQTSYMCMWMCHTHTLTEGYRYRLEEV